MLAAFDEPGTRREADPIATAKHSEMLGICVRTDEQLESLAGDGRLFAALGQGATVILHSTVSPELARRLAAQARDYGVGFVDVGVSGGGPAAIEGRLSLFIGAEAVDFERAWPWLEAIGSKLSHLGPVGRGQQGKLLNNLISIANYGMSAAIVDIGVDRLAWRSCANSFDRDAGLSATSGWLKIYVAVHIKTRHRPARATTRVVEWLLQKLKDLSRNQQLVSGGGVPHARRSRRLTGGFSTPPGSASFASVSIARAWSRWRMPRASPRQRFTCAIAIGSPC
jgi:3-hydroxyisobutyrate dehydrogenase-like beta-hydroxyacid dehydrogenase